LAGLNDVLAQSIQLDTSKNRVFEACCSDVELMNDRGG